MNTELPPFKNEEYNSESASTIDRVIAPLTPNLSILSQALELLTYPTTPMGWYTVDMMIDLLTFGFSESVTKTWPRYCFLQPTKHHGNTALLAVFNGKRQHFKEQRAMIEPLIQAGAELSSKNNNNSNVILSCLSTG